MTGTIPPALERLESEVRSYSRSWPVVFEHAVDSHLYAADGRAFLDFFAGAGSLNYGHNNRLLKRALVAYLERDGVVQGLDTMTSAKSTFLRQFNELVLQPRGLDYKVQFTGPTGTNAVEAAIKLARKVTGRPTVVAFTGAFHGMSLGSLALTGNAGKRKAAGVPLSHTLRLPFCGFGDPVISGPTLLEYFLRDRSSGIDVPAAVIVETVQAEGGLNVATTAWLHQLADLCERRDILLIVDDIQIGCGRTGPFFSFEEAGIVPDIVCLSKSISGYGLPMAVTLLRPEIDIWEPGEHNGTFRGNGMAFVTATAALQTYWRDRDLEKQTIARGQYVRSRLDHLADSFPPGTVLTRGRGLLNGVAFDVPELAQEVCGEAFRRGLVIETSGSDNEVVKLMPPLTITDHDLAEGLEILGAAVRAVLGSA